jgi:serine/threonine-protein kinase
MSMSDHHDSSAQAGDHLGRYRLVAQLGQGGMGTIHLAVTSGLGEFRKLLVVKELLPEHANNERFVDMFLSEAKLAARLNHPNIVQMIEAGEENGRYFLSMEFLDGQPLTELLKRASTEPVVTLGARLQILCEVLSGLQYAHDLCDFDGTPFEIVHRDITPHNVFLTYHGQVKLVDFGIAKAVDVESLTNAGVFKGKFAYAAPEQVRGEFVDQRSDLFAVGVMLWEAIAMRRFAPGPPTRLSVDRRLRGIEPRIREAVPDVEPVLADICDRAIHLDKECRYKSAAEFRADLERFLLVSGEPEIALDKLLSTKFAVERAAMHKLIDAYTKGDRGQSVVRSLPSPIQVGIQLRREEGPTRVGNLSNLIESSRVDNPIGGESPAGVDDPIGLDSSIGAEPPFEWGSSLRSRGNPYVWVGAGVALLLGGILWFSSAGPAPHATKPVQPPSAAPVVAPPAIAPAVPAPTETATSAATTEPTPVFEPQPAAADPKPASDARPARTWRARTASDDTSTETSSRSSRTRGADDESRSSFGSRTRSENSRDLAAATDTARADDAQRHLDPADRVRDNPYRSAPPQPMAAPRGAARPEDVVGRAGNPAPAIGQDLRGLPQRPQRMIDVEDPFR